MAYLANLSRNLIGDPEEKDETLWHRTVGVSGKTQTLNASRKLESASRNLESASRKLESASRKLESASRKLESAARRLESTQPVIVQRSAQ